MSGDPAPVGPPPVSDAAIDDLRRRVRERAAVPDPWDDDSTRGLGPNALQPLLDRWADGFDWRAQEERIAALPWQLVDVGGQTVRVVHRRARREDAPTVVLLHGWPDSVLRFERVLPLLSDLHVVVPALPGFPFAAPHVGPASVDRIADLVSGALAALGLDRVTLSAGDVGGDVAEVMAARDPDRVASMHLTNVSARHVFAVDPATLVPAAKDYVERAMTWNRQHGGYVAEQSTRPRTLLTGLGDSPAGLAAWILEKLTDWTDDVRASFSPDELLTWVSAYWFSGSIGTSFASYAGPAAVPSRTQVPTVVSSFARDVKLAPRAWIERFVELVDLVEHPSGGHFAAWEHPDRYAADLERAVRAGR